MKKIKYTLLFIVFTVSSYSQVYFNFFSGYAFSLNPTVSEDVFFNLPVMDINKTKIPFGKGMNVGIGIGYMLNNNLSAELNCNTQILTKSKINNDWPGGHVDNYYLIEYNEIIILHNKSVQFSPLLIYSLEANKFQPYFKFGLNLLHVTSNFDYDFPLANTTELKFTGKWNIGYRGALGSSIFINERISIWEEFTFVYTNYNYKKSELLSYKINEIERIQSIRNRTTEYKNKEGLTDYSNMGINIGIKYLIRNN